MLILKTAVAALAWAASVEAMPFLNARKSKSHGLTGHPKQLFEQSMEWQDGFWDNEVGYLVTADTTLPGRYDSRQSAWYAVGLVARNDKGDVERAERVIENLYRSQYKDPTKIWYGDIQQAPDEPTPQDVVYPPKPYTTYDPNWRDFVGASFVIMLGDYEDRLSPKGLKIVKEMLYLLAKGDQYRVGGLDGDNLYPSYSNPWMMRCILQSFAGEYLGDQNMTDSGEKWGKELYDLYKLYDTFSEFNSPTYTGVDMWALGLWIKYAPKNSSLPGYAQDMFGSLMQITKDLYNANLKNFAGPFDRTYGYDMNHYFTLTAATIWGLVGREYAPMPKAISGMLHIADFGLGHLIALGIPYVEDLVPKDVIESFKTYQGEHSTTAQAISPQWDDVPRNITLWSNDLITIGAQTVWESIPRDTSSFNPAVIQWYVREGRIGYINYYPSESSVFATAGEGYLDITYPNITGPVDGPLPSFTFNVSPFDVYPHDNVSSITDLPGLKMEVSGNVNTSSEIFYFNSANTVHDFFSFNSTWYMPENFTGVPHIHFEITEYPTSKNVTYN